ncbi:MAG: hypothetical protein GWN00_14280 [Aliifodinibius sp.]|nr:hypothetical protein [Fodinibius sp.]NIV12275.1 hypothetical protein [Fodinibius sp.]NIY25930.1 hypothetical protein [Fodinibius sp.]
MGKYHQMFIVLNVACFFFLTVGSTYGQQEYKPCDELSAYQKLNFWLGKWHVYDSSGTNIGENHIEKILNGCAILEHWKSAKGSQGKSLFYVDNQLQTWKQVWVTENATAPWGTKEKQLIEELEDGGVRFQGEIHLSDGKSVLDRTTLTPVKDGRVRQVIEHSTDEGKTWKLSFDAFYVRKSDH